MNRSFIYDIFLFILISVCAWCVQYGFSMVFDTLFNDCLPLALYDYMSYTVNSYVLYSLIQLIPFVLVYTLVYYLISMIAELTVFYVSDALVSKKKIRKYNLNHAHQSFFAQMLAFTVILITFGWMNLHSMMFRLVFLIFSGSFAVTVYLVLSYLASRVNDNGICLLWGLVFAISFMVTWMISGKLFFSLVFITISMYQIPIREKLSRALSGFFSYTEHRLFGISDMDEEDDEF